MIVSTLGADQRDHPRRSARLSRDGGGRIALLVDGRGAPALSHVPTPRSSCRRSGRRCSCWTGTYGTIVSRVIYTEWIFFGALAHRHLAAQARSATSSCRSARRASRSFPMLFAPSCAGHRREPDRQQSADQPDRSRALSPQDFPSTISGGNLVPVIDFHNHYYPPRLHDRRCSRARAACKTTVDSRRQPDAALSGRSTTSPCAGTAISPTGRTCSTAKASSMQVLSR